MSPIIVNREDKKRQILNAALEVFSQKGFYDASVGEIASKAGIAKGTLYDYFDSKDDLCLALLDYVVAEFFEEFAVPPTTDDPAKFLEDVFLEGLKVYQQRENLLRFFIFYWGKSLGSERDNIIQRKLRKSFQLSRSWIEKAYLKGVEEGKFRKLNPAHVSACLVAMAEFVPMQWVMDKKAFSLQEAGKTAFEIFLRGILKESEMS